MADLTDDQKEQLRELLANRDPGPWEWQGDDGWPDSITPANRDLILEAVHQLPALLDEIDRLRAENEAGRKLNVYQAQRLADLHLDAMGRGEGGDRG